MTSYEIFPGVFVLYISLKKKYNANNSSADGNRGYRIAYGYEGNFFTYINNTKVLITTNEIFVGRSIPNSKFSSTTSHRTTAFNIIIADKILEKSSAYFPYIGEFICKFKNVKDMGCAIKNEDLVKLANELIQALKERDMLFIKLKSLELIYRIGKVGINPSKTNYFTPGGDKLMEEVEKYMKENLDKNLNLDHLAKKFKISKSTLNTKFTRSFQYTPMKYIQRLKLIYSEDLLINTDKSILEISNDLNFQNPSNFNRAFKDFTGLSPSQYRKQNEPE